MQHTSFDANSFVIDSVYTDSDDEAASPLPSPSVSPARTSAGLFRMRQVPLGAGDDSESDIYVTDDDDYHHGGDDASFRAKVRAEERKIMSEFNLDGDLHSATSSSVGDRNLGTSAPTSKKMPWSASSIGTTDDPSIFNGSYTGILSRLRMFTPSRTTEKEDHDGSPGGTEKTASPTKTAGPDPPQEQESLFGGEFDGTIDGESGGMDPPTTILVNRTADSQRKGFLCCLMKPSRLIICLGILLVAALGVALGTWAVSNNNNNNNNDDQSRSSVSDSPLNEDPSGGEQPDFTFASPSPTPVVVSEPEDTTGTVIEEEPTSTEQPTEEPTKEPTSDPTQEPSLWPTPEPTTSPTSLPTDSPTSSPTLSPTLFPTESPSLSPSTFLQTQCVDDPAALFFISDEFGEQGCEWLSSKPGHRLRLCLEGNAGYLFCRQLCQSSPNCIPTSMPVIETSVPTVTVTEAPTAAGEEATAAPSTVEPTSIPTEAILIETEAPTSAIVTDPPISVETTQAPTGAPTENLATSAPTVSNTRAARDVILAISPGSSAAVRNSETAQARALGWIEANDYSNLQEWEIAQTWAVASFGLDSTFNDWFVASNWLDRPGNECNWFGVECDVENRVIGIALSQNNLVGGLVPEISLLSSLNTLDVSRNGMSGALPGDYGALFQLTNLELDRNRFSGSIPSQLGWLLNLQRLRIEFNRFTGTLPASLGNMEALEEFVMFSNSFTGTVPEGVCMLNLLESLEADCRELSCDCCSRCWFQCGGSTGIPCT